MITVNIAGRNISLKEHPQVWMPATFSYRLGHLLVDYLKPGMRVLELGVGSGVLSIIAGLNGCQVVGLDISPEAIALTRHNWQLNGLDEAQADFRVSDLFSSLRSEEQGSFDFIWSNTSTLPGIPTKPRHHADYEAYGFAGLDGRIVLDAMIQSAKWLRSGGYMITWATSRQNWAQTQQLMKAYWERSRVIASDEIPLSEYYKPFIEVWRTQEKNDGVPRIFQKGDQWYERAYIIEGEKSFYKSTQKCS